MQPDCQIIVPSTSSVDGSVKCQNVLALCLLPLLAISAKNMDLARDVYPPYDLTSVRRCKDSIDCISRPVI